MTEQQEMFKRTDHANLGKEFEAELAAAHDWYRMNRVVDIVWNKNDWDFARGRDFHMAKAAYEKGLATAARTGNGGYIWRVRSDIDFSGGGFVFDAKSTVEDRWSLQKIEAHQVRRLRDSGRCGSRAGVFIKFITADRVFWLDIATLGPLFDRYEVQTVGRRRAKPGTGSLSIDQLEEIGIEIPRHRVNRLWDWYAKLKA
jgi:penicillin-binding protein-related factor A (putative recombinase)